MGDVSKALKLQRDAQRRRALAPKYDSVRRDFDLGLAQEMDKEAQVLLTPSETLQTGLGGEIIPPAGAGLPGLESALKQPELLDLEASVQRSDLIERAGVLELGIETAKDNRAVGSVQKMISHQMAALHRRAMTMLAESEACKIPEISIKKARASARMVDAFSRCALTLQRLQSGGGQTIQVQYMQVNTMVGDESEKVQNPPVPAPTTKNKGGRPPITGYRTQGAINQRKADWELLSAVKQAEDTG
jgi:hypothetical protein